MDISTTEFKRCVTVKTSGRIDGSNAPELRKVFEELTDTGKLNIVFDMTDVNFMASAGWWVLIDTQKKAKPRGELVLANVDKSIRESLSLVGMGSYFTIYDDVVSAVGNF
ncbi:MAG: STAS domain-containing protein [Anaerolineales bacterium]|nr:STAS domain-containing protein [Anaerolineales bacterium]